MPVATATAIALGVGAAVQAGSAISAGSQKRKARAEKQQLNRQLAAAEANRQEIVDPYRNVKDLSSMLSNPYANLQVSTKAAEMQAEQQDISLASTLDTLRATGAGAGGATALAQAALQSKQGIAADIASQEATNSRLRAEGEAQLQQQRMAEASRLQQAQVAGEQYVFGAQETRDVQKLNRLAGLQAQATTAEQSAAASQTAAWAGLGGQLTSFAGEQLGK